MFDACYNNYVKINVHTFEGTEPEFVLKTVFGYDSFRQNQKKIIQSVLSGKDTLAIMPTGGGKSICYQIPALIFEGVTVIVSPLISLMQDQVSSLETAGIHSVFLNSSLGWDDYKKSMDEIRAGQVKMIYVSPEGLSTERIRTLLASPEIKVNCITIDEAHCVSQWGHDFRPDYMEIGAFRALFPDAVMIALTATATENVRQDIIKNLKLKKPEIFISSFNRENIFLQVAPKKNSLDQIVQCIKDYDGESGIIYCNSRRAVDQLAQALIDLGFSAINYHAGLNDDVRAKNQDDFVKGKVLIVVATIAFGMGINKPDVRFVINYDLPKSLEEYYQEIGRAGRDGLPATALLLYSAGDINKVRFFFDSSADPRKAEARLQGMINFATAVSCRRRILLGYFGEAYDPKKSNRDCCCDICAGGEIPEIDVTVMVQKLLCCIIRTQERFGSTYVIDVLLGSRQKRIVDNGHNMISTWGIGRELCKEDWFTLIDLCIAAGLITKYGEYNILQITEDGYSVLSTREKIMLPLRITSAGGADARDVDGTGAGSGMMFPKPGAEKPAFIVHKKADGRKVIAEKPGADDETGEKIITELKAWRRRKADDMNVPPYIIFGDKTLYDLAAKKPTDKQSLFGIYGIGEAKVEQFGKAIIAVIEDVIGEQKNDQ